MSSIGVWAGVAVSFAVLAMPAFGQRPLNPTVAVREKASSIVPTECEQGLAPAVPRAAQPLPEPATFPETSSQIANQDVAQALRRVQASAEANEREGFVEALAQARTAADAAPPGGQREAAREALRVESDIDRLWRYSLESPTGAFFDASTEGGALLTMLRQYPDYGRRIADAVLVVGGQTLYPTRESRQFLVQQAASRLVRLGIHSAPRAPRPPSVVRSQPAPETPVNGLPSASVPSSEVPPKSIPRSATVPSKGSSGNASGVAVTSRPAKSSTTRATSSTSTSGSRAGTSQPAAGRTKPPVATTKVASKARPSSTSRPTRTSVAATAPPTTAPPTTVPKTTVPKTIPPAAPTGTVASTATQWTTVPPPTSTSAIPKAASSATPSTATVAATTTTATASISTANPSTSSTVVPAPASTWSAEGSGASPAGSSSGPTVATGDTAPFPNTVTETAPSTTAAEPTGARGGKLNLMFAVILIVAGIGLLVLFLRASD
ncbi:MAG: hypothetical protein ABIP63_04805 [Thermoanaerobaculia bacterium]